MERVEIEQIILKYIRENYLNRLPDHGDVTVQTHLFQEGIVDSIGVLMLVQFVEEQFQLRVEADEMVIDNFASVSCMSRFVESKRGG